MKKISEEHNKKEKTRGRLYYRDERNFRKKIEDEKILCKRGKCAEAKRINAR